MPVDENACPPGLRPEVCVPWMSDSSERLSFPRPSDMVARRQGMGRTPNKATEAHACFQSENFQAGRVWGWIVRFPIWLSFVIPLDTSSSIPFAIALSLSLSSAYPGSSLFTWLLRWREESRRNLWPITALQGHRYRRARDPLPCCGSQCNVFFVVVAFFVAVGTRTNSLRRPQLPPRFLPTREAVYCWVHGVQSCPVALRWLNPQEVQFWSSSSWSMVASGPFPICPHISIQLIGLTLVVLVAVSPSVNKCGPKARDEAQINRDAFGRPSVYPSYKYSYAVSSFAGRYPDPTAFVASTTCRSGDEPSPAISSPQTDNGTLLDALDSPQESSTVGTTLVNFLPTVELVNELVFTWRLPTLMVEGIVYSVVQATVDVCYGGDVDDVDLEMGERYEFDEPANDSGTSPVPRLWSQVLRMLLSLFRRNPVWKKIGDLLYAFEMFVLPSVYQFPHCRVMTSNRLDTRRTGDSASPKMNASKAKRKVKPTNPL
ncbi:hypothetical protein BJ322DRAFT_1016719 [Thelephora terrestris]|uniref:Uncharacterized protein n=1 Tax=Thelephora terrestris TaxID=56493 RepID=A0A9P6HTD6_9AGAM|nr:hypothetical protein BJ322DRAFT_1016719 [Thelephora terrestris]